MNKRVSLHCPVSFIISGQCGPETRRAVGSGGSSLKASFTSTKLDESLLPNSAVVFPLALPLNYPFSIELHMQVLPFFKCQLMGHVLFELILLHLSPNTQEVSPSEYLQRQLFILLALLLVVELVLQLVCACVCVCFGGVYKLHPKLCETRGLLSFQGLAQYQLILFV